MFRSLVTGGTGFVGSNLVLELSRLGHEVIAADLNVDTQRVNLSDFSGEIMKLDTAEPWRVEGKFDYVFHQAAITDPRYPDDTDLIAKNVNGFEHCLRFCVEKGARLVYASTAGLYGNGPIPMREDQTKELLTAYGNSKWMMDQMAENWFDQLPVVGLRYFNVFGPRESLKGRPASMIYHLGAQIRERKLARLFNYGEQVRDHIYVKDAVNANLCAMKATTNGVFNVGTGKGTNFNDLVKILNEVLGTNASIEYFPMPYSQQTYQANTVADTTLGREKFGFQSQWSLKDAVRDYYSHLGWL